MKEVVNVYVLRAGSKTGLIETVRMDQESWNRLLKDKDTGSRVAWGLPDGAELHVVVGSGNGKQENLSRFYSPKMGGLHYMGDFLFARRNSDKEWEDIRVSDIKIIEKARMK